MVGHSAVNYTAEHHKPLFWRRLAIKLSPLLVPQLCPAYPEQMVRIGSTPVNSPISHSPVDCHFSEYALHHFTGLGIKSPCIALYWLRLGYSSHFCCEDTLDRLKLLVPLVVLLSPGLILVGLAQDQLTIDASKQPSPPA
jgi:hypothetical protein